MRRTSMLRCTSRLRRRARLAIGAALALPAACGDRAEQGPPSSGPPAGTYAVVQDSSSVHALVQRDGEPAVVTFPRPAGSITLREDARTLIEGNGTVSVDLGRAVMDDSLQARALVDDLLRARTGGSRREAELRIRSLFGRRFTTALPVGGVTPLSARAQLIVAGMAVSRQFEGEISRTPSGYRITTAVPVLLTLRELGLDDDLPRWLAATGVRDAGAWVAVTLDLRLVRRGPA